MAAGLSVVIDAMIDVAERIEAAPWPAHPTTTRTPKVGKALETIESPDEWIDVSSRTDDNSEIVWTRIAVGAPQRRDERFWLDVLIASDVPHRSRIAALQRLNELKAVLERLFVDAAGVYHPVGEAFPWSANLGGVRQVVARADRTDQGWTARAIVSIAVAARI